MFKSHSIKLEKIKSSFILKHIFNCLADKKELEILKYNKELKSKLNIGFHNYIFYKFYSKIKSINSKTQLILDYNKSTNVNSLYNLIDLKIKNIKTKEEILTNFFNDISKKNNNICINYFINDDSYSLNQFKFLISFNKKIKIILHIDYLSCFHASDNSNKIYKNQIEILKMIDKKDTIYGIDYNLNRLPDSDLNCDNNFLNIINNILKNTKFVKIPCKLIMNLINKQIISFFENNFKKFEIHIDNNVTLLNFRKILNEIIQFLLDTEELIIKNNSPGYISDGNKAYINFCEIKNLKKLILHDLYSELIFSSKFCERLLFLNLQNVDINYSSELIKFPNLNTLIIKNTCLINILNIKDIDFESFSHLEHLDIDIDCLSCFIILNKLIKYSTNLIEFDISYEIEDKSYYERDLCEEEISEYKLNLNKEEESEEDSEDDETNIFKKYRLILEKMENKFLINLLELKNIKILRINDFDPDSVFISGFLEEYKNENLVEIQSNCIPLSKADNFFKNNQNINLFEFDKN